MKPATKTTTKSKSKTQHEELIALIKENSGTHIIDCNFSGVRFDAKAVDAISLIAQGLIENAKANGTNAEGLSSLAQVLRASNVTVETMLKIDGNK